MYPASWVCASESEPFCVLLMLVVAGGGVRSIEVRSGSEICPVRVKCNEYG